MYRIKTTPLQIQQEIRRKEMLNPSKFKTTLIFPPQWTPLNPHFAVTSLAGHLKENGYEVQLRDLNIEFFDYILTPEYIEFCIQKALLDCNSLATEILLRFGLEDNSAEFDLSVNKFFHIEKYLKENSKVIRETIDRILEVKEVLRCPEGFYNPYYLVDALNNIDHALEIISLPYSPSRLHFNDFYNPSCPLNIDNIVDYCRNKDNNMFYRFYESVMPKLWENRSDLIAISINSFSQVLPGLSLAMMLKEKREFKYHISIGGNFFTRLKKALLNKPQFFHIFADSLVLGEGEKSILELIRVLEKGKSLHDVPSLLFLSEDGEEVLFSYQGEPEKLDKIGFQSLEGLPLEKYFSPTRVLCIRASKGCYWGKCTFCDSDFGVTPDVRSIDSLIEEIEYLKNRYGIRNFEFIDECLNPDYMEKMAHAFKKAKLNIHWFANARTETSFFEKRLLDLRNSGLTMLLWGVESGNQRIMKLINKGVSFDKRIDILSRSARVGIWNFAYIFFGFPSETESEAMDTINFICKNTEVIHSYGRSIFTLGKHSKLCQVAKKYGIIDIIEDPQEFSTNLHYKTTRGMNNEQISEMVKKCTRMCTEAYGNPLWMYLRYREILHLYLVKYGYRFIRQFKFDQKPQYIW